MERTKVIRDSIHGYIEVEPMFKRIIETPEFQRLKWVEQSSFRVLYPSARHDRFVHSLGVFHLSKIMFDNFFRNISEDLNINFSKNKQELFRNTLMYASLLHDVGHSPFSHTGEYFFYKNNIKEMLIEEVEKIPENKNSNFRKDCGDFSSTKPHEIISALILLRNAENFLGENIQNVKLEFAVRMITGVSYKSDENPKIYEKGIRNCLISLLNSDTIDVDKLDYIIRDTAMSGFDNASIDIYRLTKSITAIEKNGVYHLAYRKTALSVIDNVFKGKIEEGLWVVSHPTVAYESRLIQSLIVEYSRTKKDYLKQIFSYDGVSVKGVEVEGREYKLVSDADVLVDIKSLYPDSKNAMEFFNRGERKHPLLKSYYDYKHYALTCKNINNPLVEITAFFEPLIKFISEEENNYFSIDNEVYAEIMKVKENVEDNIKRPLEFLYQFSLQNNIEFNYTTVKLENKFSKINPEKIYILFGQQGREFLYGKYSELKSENERAEILNFCHIYSKQRYTNEQLEMFFKQLDLFISKYQ